ncbi:MAG: hypothetical protein HYW49_09815 [Deltaproteobacteria bacterium]|nr:hypothetical protein [Deltaproteobacteria bacterium]
MNAFALAEEMLNRASFALRDRYWGRWKLRPGLPDCEFSEGETGFYRMVLRSAGVEQRGASAACVDIGCRNWSYAQALAEYFPEAKLLGVELDGGRRYWNFHRRIDCALAAAECLAKNGRGARALHADFLNLTFEDVPSAAFAVFCFFFPFVSERPCRKWGIPSRYSDFRMQLAHAKKLGASEILSCHQGEWEAEIAREAYQRADLHPRESVLAPDDFKNLWPSRYPVHIFRVQSSL